MALEHIVNGHKLKIVNSAAAFALSAFLAVTSATSLSCGKSDSGQAPGISAQLQDMWPVWKPEDLEINNQRGAIVQYDHELNVRPPFYKGKMPLHYVGQQTIGAGMMSGTQKALKHEFDDFSNYFIYEHFVLSGIVAVNNSKTMVAEANITYGAESGRQKMMMEEFHYDDGLLVFHCQSEVDYVRGIKTSESEKSGRKRRDYFFIVPTGINE